MNVNSIEFSKLNNLFFKWLAINDLDANAITDPVRAVAWGFYVAKQDRCGLFDQWNVREFVQLQIDSLSMFGEVQGL